MLGRHPLELAARIRSAANMLASAAEKEVERLMKEFLKDGEFHGKVFGVGGYVRDEILGIDSNDLDIVIEIKGGAERLGNAIHSEFPESTTKPIPLGAGYPIWKIEFKGGVEYRGESYGTGGASIDLVDTQKEAFPDPESRQRVVEYGTLKEDIERRDFTVNMLLKDLTTGEIVDLTGSSVKDINDGVLQGNPNVDFDKILKDDPLRMIRLVRFQAKYGWSVPDWVAEAVERNAARIEIVSGERIRGELEKIMELGKLAQAVESMRRLGLLKHVLPEIEAMRGVEHEYSKGIHQEGDVLAHTLLVLRNAKPGIMNQLAALLHDVGKPKSRNVVEGLANFIGHDKVGGEIAEGVMRRLKFDGETIRKVRKMVESHMTPHFIGGEKSMARFVRDVGEELVEAVLDLAEADCLGTLPPRNEVPDLRRQIDEIIKKTQKAKQLPISGDDVQRILGIGPGKQVGLVLKRLKDKQVELALEGVEMDAAMAEGMVKEDF